MKYKVGETLRCIAPLKSGFNIEPNLNECFAIIRIYKLANGLEEAHLSNQCNDWYLHENQLDNCFEKITELDATRLGFYKTRDGCVALFVKKLNNDREANLLFIVHDEIEYATLYLPDGRYTSLKIDSHDLVEYLGVELPQPKAEPRKFEFEGQMNIELSGNYNFNPNNLYFPEFHPLQAVSKNIVSKWKVTMEEILE